MQHGKSCAHLLTPQSEIGRLYDFLIASDPVGAAQAERDMEILAPRGEASTPTTSTSSTSQPEGSGLTEMLLSRLSRTMK